MAEGETQYNIPVSSKQLIVYFVFLVIALSAAFLAGVMVGRNVDSSPEPTVRDIQDDRLPEEPASSPPPDELTYGSALQSDKIEGLSSASGSEVPSAPGASSKAGVPAPPSRATPKSMVASIPRPTREPPRPAATVQPPLEPKATPKPAPSARPSNAAPTPVSRLTIQVGAFRERAAADAIVKRLKAKGYSAYMVPVSEGLFNVRVGSFTNREDAERILKQLEIQEKFKPFIVKP